MKQKNNTMKSIHQYLQNEPTNIEVRPPKTKKEWYDYYYLRWKVLRSNFSDNIDSAKDDIEDESFHIIAINSNLKILGVGRIHELDRETSQIRYMAVEKKSRSNNVGTLILKCLISHAIEKKNKQIILQARENAINFYLKNGFKLKQKTHILFGEVQHYLMKITL